MEIKDIKVTPVSVPFSSFGKFEPVTMHYAVRYATNSGIIFIETDGDITGVGCTKFYRGEGTTVLNVIKPMLTGKDPFELERIANSLERRRISADLRAAVDMALWDIIGKECNRPVYKLLGGKINEKVFCRYWQCMRSPEEMAVEAKMAVERGWKAFKMKFGAHPADDLARLKAIREAVGDDIELGMDLNESYTVPSAIRVIKKMEKYDPSHVESPIPTWNLKGFVEIKKHVDVPIEYHGLTTMANTLRLVELQAADALSMSPHAVGSLLLCKRICAVAEAGGIITCLQSSAAELGPSNSAMLHLVTSTPSFTWTNDNSNHFLEPPSDDIIKKPFKTTDGYLTAPEGPGLGVEIDDKKLKKANKNWISRKYEYRPGIGVRDPYIWGSAVSAFPSRYGM